MKEIKTYIIEKLKVGVRNTTKHTLFPKTKEELKQMINDEISKNGNECSLNHIDVSEITDMSRLFNSSIFNGDISKWNVSNVKDMKYMFFHSKFNGDISEWDVSGVNNMTDMFCHTTFNGDISNWDVSNVTNMFGIFTDSPLQNNPPKWFKE